MLRIFRAGSVVREPVSFELDILVFFFFRFEWFMREF